MGPAALFSSAHVRSPNKSRGSGTATDVKRTMDTSGQGLSQQPSFSAVTASTLAQSKDLAFMEMYRQTHVLLSDFLKEKNQQNSRHQPFYNSIAAEADRLFDARCHSFQAEVFKLLQRYKCQDTQSQPTTPKTIFFTHIITFLCFCGVTFKILSTGLLVHY